MKAAGHDDSILDRLTSKPNENEFWQHQGEGLAIYLTPNDCRMFRLNRSVDEKVCVGESFFVQPLIRESNSGGEYFVLSLSWDEASLFRAAGESEMFFGQWIETLIDPAMKAIAFRANDQQDEVELGAIPNERYNAKQATGIKFNSFEVAKLTESFEFVANL